MKKSVLLVDRKMEENEFIYEILILEHYALGIKRY